MKAPPHMTHKQHWTTAEYTNYGASRRSTRTWYLHSFTYLNGKHVSGTGRRPFVWRQSCKQLWSDINGTCCSVLFSGYEKCWVFPSWHWQNLDLVTTNNPFLFLSWLTTAFKAKCKAMSCTNCSQTESSQVCLLCSCTTVLWVLLQHLERNHTCYLWERLDGEEDVIICAEQLHLAGMAKFQ